MQTITTPNGEKLLALAEYEKPVDQADGLSACDLAAATGLSAPYISKIASGKKEGSISAIKKIAETLKVDLDDLV